MGELSNESGTLNTEHIKTVPLGLGVMVVKSMLN